MHRSSDQQKSQSDFRTVVMTGAPPRVVARLLSEIISSSGQPKICGVLYWVPRRLTTKQRIFNVCRQLHKASYLQYAANRVLAAGMNAARRVGQTLWKTVHASFPRESDFGIEELRLHCEDLGIPFQTASNFHSEQSLEFVSATDPDLGIVYGTPILKPELFEIPRCGSVNLHQRKVPDYRGGGPVGLWELLNGEHEIGVTVHRVATKLDAGAVVQAASIPIEPADTLTSLEFKAHVTGIDLLVTTVNQFAAGTAIEEPQTGTGTMFRNPKPEDMPKILQQLARIRPECAIESTYPKWKIVARFAFLTPWLFMRNWYRRLTGTFPVVVLYHHVISDRPHFMGMSTQQFLNQMNYLRRYYDVVDLATARQRLRAGRVSQPTVVLTFDDGYQDNVLNLRAAALAGDVPAMLYVSSDHLESGRPFSHDLERGFEGFFPMSWQELQKMQAWGFDFGAHTRTHFDCASTDSARLFEEIAISRREIETHSQTPISDFSFPYGLPDNISGQAFRIASQTFTTVASAYGGVNRVHQDGEHHLYRMPHLANMAELELQLQSVLVFEQPAYWTGGATADERTTAEPEPTNLDRELVEV